MITMSSFLAVVIFVVLCPTASCARIRVNEAGLDGTSSEELAANSAAEKHMKSPPFPRQLQRRTLTPAQQRWLILKGNIPNGRLNPQQTAFYNKQNNANLQRGKAAPAMKIQQAARQMLARNNAAATKIQAAARRNKLNARTNPRQKMVAPANQPKPWVQLLTLYDEDDHLVARNSWRQWGARSDFTDAVHKNETYSGPTKKTRRGTTDVAVPPQNMKALTNFPKEQYTRGIQRAIQYLRDSRIPGKLVLEEHQGKMNTIAGYKKIKQLLETFNSVSRALDTGSLLGQHTVGLLTCNGREAGESKKKNVGRLQDSLTFNGAQFITVFEIAGCVKVQAQGITGLDNGLLPHVNAALDTFLKNTQASRDGPQKAVRESIHRRASLVS